MSTDLRNKCYFWFFVLSPIVAAYSAILLTKPPYFFYDFFGDIFLPTKQVVISALYVLLWVILSTLSFFSVRFKRLVSFAVVSVSVEKLAFFLAAISLIASGILHLTHTTAGLKQILFSFSICCVASAALCIQSMQTKVRISMLILFSLNIAVILLVIIFSRMSNSIAFALLGLLYVVFYLRMTAWVKLISLCLSAILVILSHYYVNIFRSEDALVKKNQTLPVHYAKGYKNYSGSLKFFERKRLRVLGFSQLKALHIENPVISLVQRFYDMKIFTALRMKTPAAAPFLDGLSYQYMLYDFIPRLLYSKKPVDHMGQYIGHYYDFITPSNIRTSFGVGIPAEGYINFGVPGIIASAIFYGLFVGLIWESVLVRMAVSMHLIFSSTMCYCLAQGLSGMHIVVGNTLHVLMVFGFVMFIYRFYVFLRGWKKKHSDGVVAAQ